jgi:hypothetical protein
MKRVQDRIVSMRKRLAEEEEFMIAVIFVWREGKV